MQRYFKETHEVRNLHLLRYIKVTQGMREFIPEELNLRDTGNRRTDVLQRDTESEKA